MVLYLLLIILWRRVVITEIKNLGASKASQEDDILTKIVKENSDIFSSFTYQSFKNVIDVCIFSTSLKLANITPVYKKGSKNSKENYRLVSIFPNISKIYERSFFNLISNYFENIFSKFQCWISIIEKWKNESFCCPSYRPFQSFWLSPTWSNHC